MTQYPETLNCIPILLAKREFDIMAMDEEGQIDFHFDKLILVGGPTHSQLIRQMLKEQI